MVFEEMSDGEFAMISVMLVPLCILLFIPFLGKIILKMLNRKDVSGNRGVV